MISEHISLQDYLRSESLEGCMACASARQEGRILCDSRSCSETYTNVLYEL